LLELHASAGNRTLAPLLSAAQRKMTVGPAGDRYEQEADAISRQVVESIRSGQAVQSQGSAHGTEAPEEMSIARRIQRRGAVGAEGGDLDHEAESLLQSQMGGGQPLQGGVRRTMEQAFGADFSGVRVHGDETSSRLNQHMQASAFTIGSDIFFGSGQPDVSHSGGQELLAHELTHVVQQGGAGPIAAG
jgi:hypothetical protein